jgi:rubrerythrin
MGLNVGIIQDIERMLRNLNGYELLSYAICNEECAAETYEWLAEHLDGETAEEFRRLAAEKRKHALTMRELFQDSILGWSPLNSMHRPLMPFLSVAR